VKVPVATVIYKKKKKNTSKKSGGKGKMIEQGSHLAGAYSKVQLTT
jgi:hypothetical protein